MEFFTYCMDSFIWFNDCNIKREKLMSQFDITKLPQGPKGFVHDLGSDQKTFKGVPWGKAMMWIFLLSDTFIFS